VIGRRQYPDRPYVGVGAVIVQDGQVLLVKRKYEPLAGQWSLPGGAVEIGETLESCLVREMVEETGLEVSVGPVIEVFDRITRDDEGRVMYHFVLVDYLCWPIAGELSAGSDVADARFVDPTELYRYDLTAKAISVIEQAVLRARHGLGPVA
jgi:8-oxo-dGTP diphosphatase